MLFRSNETGEIEWFATPFPAPGRKWQISSGTTWGWAHWTRGGREVVYVDGERRLVAVSVADGPGSGELTIGPPQVLFDVPGTIGGYDVTPDGERFLFIQNATERDEAPLTLVVNWPAGVGR